MKPRFIISWEKRACQREARAGREARILLAFNTSKSIMGVTTIKIPVEKLLSFFKKKVGERKSYKAKRLWLEADWVGSSKGLAKRTVVILIAGHNGNTRRTFEANNCIGHFRVTPRAIGFNRFTL